MSTYLYIYCLLRLHLLFQLQLQFNSLPLFITLLNSTFINNNNVDTSSISIFVTMTSFLPSATRTPQQQLPSERDPITAMAMTIFTHRQQHSRTRTGNRNRKTGSRLSKQQHPPFINMDVRANEERAIEERESTRWQYRDGKDMWLIQRGEGRADKERGTMWCW